ncbi:MAG: hypothetical protein QM586_09925 [Xenophilus sp.]
MTDSSSDWALQVDRLSEQGSSLSEVGKHDAAIKAWSEALELVPEPHSDWEEAVWLNASIADSYYQIGQYEKAKNHLFDALNGPEAQGQPFIPYLLGKALWHLQDERYTEYFLRAYMLDGEDIFRADDDDVALRALNALKDKGLV